MNPDQLSQALGSTDPDTLLQDTLGMDYLSAIMTGITDSLTTCVSEAHFVPVSFPNGNLQIAEKAKPFGDQLSFTPQDWSDLSAGMSKTPFASLVDLPADINQYSPFKPVTHGQFPFTKLNIIDKFGQMVVGIDRALTPTGLLTHNYLFPCLGEAYSLESFNGKANAVMQRADAWCSFVQIPPCINQPARINASFINRYQNNMKVQAWRRNEQWDNPILGWVVINSANVSLQFFTNDGRFIREYSVLNGHVMTHPYTADASLASDVPFDLNQLMQQIDGSPDYLKALFQSISTTVQAVQANSSHHAESMLSILGRPLALTTFGFNIELASPPLTDQSTFVNTRTVTPSVTDYSFSVKVGDGDNVFDGLYGLFNPLLGVGLENLSFDLSKFFSYHASDPQLSPPIFGARPIWPLQDNPADYTECVDGQLTPLLALVDPFVPIHFYTALLPIKQLQLPPWAVDRGIARIASFFKKGPTLVPTDAPPFQADTTTTKYVVDQDIPLDDPNQPVPTGEIPIPAVSAGDWTWLQPYATGDGGAQLKYNELTVTKPEDKPRWEQAPYVITEGYLQMKKPFTAPDPVKAPELSYGPGPAVPA